MKIALTRKLKGITQTQLAFACETTQQQIAKIESGVVDPRLSTLRKIAQALGCELEDLFYTRKEFLKQINSLVAEKDLNLRKITLMELNSVCADEKKIPTFHPFWEEVAIKGNTVQFKEKNHE
jgi:transcriptional regulator with XRE-family HTH domain